MEATEWAHDLASGLLVHVQPSRWAHTQGVAQQARSLHPILGPQVDLVEVAAWLHDIGTSPPLALTGFHPLDGARYLRDAAAGDQVLCTLVAHHSGAIAEAEERGLAAALLSEFPLDRQGEDDLLAALTYCDMTVGLNGEIVSVQDRISDILQRFPADHPVHRAMSVAAPLVLTQCQSIAAALSATTDSW